MLAWALKGLPGSSVAIPDAIVVEVIAAANATGAFPLDQYASETIAVERVEMLRTCLVRALNDRLEGHRNRTLVNLRLKHWEDWAQGMFDHAVQADDVLSVLRALESLCAQAQQLGLPILHDAD